MPSPSDDPRTEAAVFQSMTLLSALTTAAAVWRAIRERRAGQDPSAQEAEAVVRPRLHRAVRDLSATLMRLHAGLACPPEAPPPAALVRRFDDLLALREATQLLQTIHQRLLSLYPAVSEALVEDVRRLHHAGRALLEDEDAAFPAALAAFAEDGFAVEHRLRAELGLA
ncbi:MAG: hypothetical protein D6685_09530 [Bacteroidetes bacterium]|nr:MAG: hypothetical protein D6685_09530 [Bacteroidota bacterium]